jgi:hypothetical protein
VRPKYVREARRLLEKSIIHVETEDVNLDDEPLTGTDPAAQQQQAAAAGDEAPAGPAGSDSMEGVAPTGEPWIVALRSQFANISVYRIELARSRRYGRTSQAEAHALVRVIQANGICTCGACQSNCGYNWRCVFLCSS